jgi:hypothetical protein
MPEPILGNEDNPIKAGKPDSGHAQIQKERPATLYDQGTR